jgi:hypothetical protein
MLDRALFEDHGRAAPHPGRHAVGRQDIRAQLGAPEPRGHARSGGDGAQHGGQELLHSTGRRVIDLLSLRAGVD